MVADDEKAAEIKLWKAQQNVQTLRNLEKTRKELEAAKERAREALRAQPDKK